ncbi:M20 family metallo-hydrolase [Methanocaldococcus fervens]|uniref:Acetylornithine deacetylase or succinyl-diaminopimelate desuccinylase n=1 Tax=Methanocaldococcus fervens (strain DSM 4213 / JCM 15782 / AG86) TaxID=573064 RepID=C7P7I3_METFA|nr:M20 family metallo-hydrolase [Methanocaldococcus fervens]ACV24515.1 acetylornithine deacetylase or succinyl-diaminopimelate desuccinylase [Methanocaldococcus fervens AG86]
MLIEEAIKLEKDLIKINSVNPSFGGKGEKEKAEYVKRKLIEYVDKYNIKNYTLKEYNTIDKYGIERPNIVFKIDFKKDRTLHIISHLDTVPEGDISLWETNPYEPVVKDGKIYGRGTEDNHKGIVSSLLLLKMIFENNIEPKYNLSLIFVSDEEDGSEYGLKYLLNFEDEIFKKDDLIIVPDFGTPTGEYIEIGEKGILWIKFNIKGRQCHGSTPENGLNANIVAFNFVNELYNNLYERFNEINPIFLPEYSTFEPTILKNKVENPNTIPGYVEVVFDCRVLPTYTIDEILKFIDDFIKNFDFKKYIKHYNRSVKVEITYDILKSENPNYSSENSEVVKELKKAIKKVLNREAKLCGMGGGTVAAFLRCKGYDVAVWGIGEETAHQPNEHIKVEDLVKMAEVFYEILKQ